MSVTVRADDFLDVRVTAGAFVEADEPGVEVRISEISARITPSDDDALEQEIAEIFAPYLTDYSDMQITIGMRALDPTDFIASGMGRKSWSPCYLKCSNHPRASVGSLTHDFQAVL